jgi:predicted transcriptional regulator
MKMVVKKLAQPQKERQEEENDRHFSKDNERSVGSGNNKRNCKRDCQETSGEITSYEGEVLGKLAETFNAGLSNLVRIKMLSYCLEKRSFSDIMLTFRLNPASLKHHIDLLQASELIKKTGRGKDTRYKTTHLGETLLSFVCDVREVVKMT